MLAPSNVTGCERIVRPPPHPARSSAAAAPTHFGDVYKRQANGDETIGEIIASAMEKVGKEGVITVEEAKACLLYTSRCV